MPCRQHEEMQITTLASGTTTPSTKPSPIADTNPTTSPWDPIIGLGTLALALGTFYQAWKTRDVAEATRRSVEASWRLAEAAEKQIDESRRQSDLTRLIPESSIRPVLADLPLGSGRQALPILED